MNQVKMFRFKCCGCGNKIPCYSDIAGEGIAEDVKPELCFYPDCDDVNWVEVEVEASKPITNPYEEEQHRMWVRRQEVEIARMEFDLGRDKAACNGETYKPE